MHDERKGPYFSRLQIPACRIFPLLPSEIPSFVDQQEIMKRTLISSLSVTVLFLSGLNGVYAQNSGKQIAKNKQAQVAGLGIEKKLGNPAMKGLSLDHYEKFRLAVLPLIEEMGAKKIVALGESTHGTAEFYKLRFWISRILVEEKGFRHIAFENDMMDTWFLNQELAQHSDLDGLMKKYLLSIWQNKETKAMLEWVKKYNATHDAKVVLDGLDYPFLTPDVLMVEKLLKNVPGIKADLDTLRTAAKIQDSAWEGMNQPDYKLDFPVLTKSSYQAYLLAEKLKAQLTNMNLSAEDQHTAKLALGNFQQGTSPFYAMTTGKTELSRDSNMASNVAELLIHPSDKMIIWAHNAHLAKTGIYNNEVGGTGGHLLKTYPGNYFVLGTGTATGTFTSTTDGRITKSSPMSVSVLESPVQGSWESEWSQTTLPAFYFKASKLNPGKAVKPMRFIGYGPDSSPKKNDSTNISDLFDAFLFIKESHAATPLDQ